MHVCIKSHLMIVRNCKFPKNKLNCKHVQPGSQIPNTHTSLKIEETKNMTNHDKFYIDFF